MKGNTFANCADYFFWGKGGRNQEGGIKNMMDIPDMVQWDDNTAMKVTKEGKKITPTLDDYATDRPFHVDQLKNDWELEIAFATDSGTQKADRCDPCIVHNTKTDGRLIQFYQTANQDDPKGESHCRNYSQLLPWRLSAHLTLTHKRNFPHSGETLNKGDNI